MIVELKTNSSGDIIIDESINLACMSDCKKLSNLIIKRFNKYYKLRKEVSKLKDTIKVMQKSIKILKG